MPRELFRDVVHPTAELGSRNEYTLPLTAVVHVLVVAGLVALPLLAPDVLPVPASVMAFLEPTTPSPVPPQPPSPTRPSAPAARLDVNPDAAPREAPSEIRPETGIAGSAEAGSEMAASGPPEGVTGSIQNGLPEPPPPSIAPVVPVRPGGNIRYPSRIRAVPPVYPIIAQAARVQGVVVIEAILGTDGKVTDVRVMQSIPLLDHAAIEAVRQWEYTPTLLNGVPVPVIMTVRVTFTLRVPLPE